MIRNNKHDLIVSSIVILLPMLFGLFFWNRLPEEVAIHWGIDGNADGWSGRAFAVFATPLFILAAHWLCIFCTVKDPKNKDQNDKVMGMVLWIAPICSMLAGGLIYTSAFGLRVNAASYAFPIMGLAFVIIGNYLPKCKQNSTIGIRVKWAMEDEENWNATHRFGGRFWVICGLMIMSFIFLPAAAIPWISLFAVIPLTGVPIAYSYLYYKKHLK